MAALAHMPCGTGATYGSARICGGAGRHGTYAIYRLIVARFDVESPAPADRTCGARCIVSFHCLPCDLRGAYTMRSPSMGSLACITNRGPVRGASESSRGIAICAIYAVRDICGTCAGAQFILYATHDTDDITTMWHTCHRCHLTSMAQLLFLILASVTKFTCTYMHRVYATLNQKGGTGKTTSAVNIAHALARRGDTVLLVDNDAQGNASSSLGIREPDLKGEGILTIYREPETSLSVVRQQVRERLYLIGGHSELASVEHLLIADAGNGPYRLADKADEFRAYDSVIIDCPPNLSLLSLNALTLINELVSQGATGGILVPINMEPLAVEGIGRMMKKLNRWKRLIPHVEIKNVIPTFYDPRNNKTHAVMQGLSENFGEKVTPPVRTNVRISEAPDKGQTALEFDEDGKGEADYEQITDYILNHG